MVLVEWYEREREGGFGRGWMGAGDYIRLSEGVYWRYMSRHLGRQWKESEGRGTMDKRQIILFLILLDTSQYAFAGSRSRKPINGLKLSGTVSIIMSLHLRAPACPTSPFIILQV
jgi:hypothetical protein